MGEEKTVFQPSMVSMLAAVPIAFFIGLWLLLILLPLLQFGAIGLVAYLILLLVILLGPLVWSYFSIKTTFIEIKPEGILVRRGIIAKSQSTFLYTQIQDVTESQSFLDMIFDLKTIRFRTMTFTSAFGGRVSGMKKTDADYIRSVAIQKISPTLGAQTPTSSPSAFAMPAQPQADDNLVKGPYPLHFLKLFFFTSLPLAVIGFFVLIAVFLYRPEVAFFGLLYGFGFFGVGFVSQLFVLISYRYSVGKTRLEIEQGIISFDRDTVFFAKAQDIVLFRSLFDRLAGLASITIETGEVQLYQATSRRRKMFPGNFIPALDFENAKTLRQLVLDFLGLNVLELSPSLVGQLPLEGTKVVKKSIAWSVPIVFLAALLGFFFFSAWPQTADSSLFVVGGVILIAFVFAAIAVYQHFYLKFYYYNVSPGAIVLRKGVFNIKEMVVPFNKIQNIFVDQDILDRAFGLYDVHFSTVTPGSGFHLHIDGLNKQNSERIRNILSELVSKSMKKKL